jgi:hypothetical protein
MSTADEIRAIEAKAHRAGIKMAEVLRTAEIDRSMWTRWKNNTTVPRLDNWRAVEKALDTLSNRKVSA